MATLTPDSARAAYNVELERRLFEKWVRAFERGRAKQVSYAVPSAPTKVELRDAMWLHGRTWGKPHQPTEMEVWTTDEALRIRVACTEERMSEIYRGETGRDAPIFNAESVEFFVGVGDGVYRQMGVDAAGGTYEVAIPERREYQAVYLRAFAIRGSQLIALRTDNRAYIDLNETPVPGRRYEIRFSYANWDCEIMCFLFGGVGRTGGSATSMFQVYSGGISGGYAFFAGSLPGSD
mgnify:CR=1 FL=1